MIYMKKQPIPPHLSDLLTMCSDLLDRCIPILEHPPKPLIYQCFTRMQKALCLTLVSLFKAFDVVGVKDFSTQKAICMK